MTYAAPIVTSAGLTIPAYSDIRDSLIASSKTIFGSDIYLGTDSQDYQWISAVAAIIYDSFLTSQMVYNARGPSTAIGSNLDIIVKINGLKRKAAVYSTAYVTLSGAAGTFIMNGIVTDANNNQWTLTTPITLDGTGSATALATCQTVGAVSAITGSINKITTPTLGWTSVTNAAAATVGALAETDAALRARQATSTAQPSRTVLEGVKGNIAAVTGVTRNAVYENDTNATDANGLPAHSITAVVENGADADVANAIYNKKGPGCYTNGTTSISITDAFGVQVTIRFYRPSYVDIDVVLNVKKLTSYTTVTKANIQNAVSAYISSLTIGSGLTLSSLWGAALSVNTNPANPLFSLTSLTAARHLGAQLTAALTSGTAYTSITVQALTVPVASGATLVIGTGSTTQTVIASAAAAIGATSISVNSFTANAAYASGTAVSFAQGTTDIALLFNEVTRGNVANIIVNES